MNIRILKKIQGRKWNAGTVVTVTRSLGLRLIESGQAEEVGIKNEDLKALELEMKDEDQPKKGSKTKKDKQ